MSSGKPANLKRRVEDLVTVNHFGLGPSGNDYFAALTPEKWAEYAPVQRPLVMRHRLSGRPYLEFRMIHTSGFVGISQGESVDLLRELEAHASQDANVYYHAWRPEQRRVMLRAMVNESYLES